jgi:hypothetical protein
MASKENIFHIRVNKNVSEQIAEISKLHGGNESEAVKRVINERYLDLLQRSSVIKDGQS